MRIYHISNIIMCAVVGAIGGGCDEGRLYNSPLSGASTATVELKVCADVLDAATWPSYYTVSIAAYANESDYALVSKSIGSRSAESGLYEMTLSNVPAEATTVEIGVVDRLRRRITTFRSFDIVPGESCEFTPSEAIDANMYGVVQNNIFNTTCANCHGGSSFSAAGLNLTALHSHVQLVGQPSVVMNDGSLRVKEGSRASSVLYNILAGELSASWNYDHSVEIVDNDVLELIGQWIDNGAQE